MATGCGQVTIPTIDNTQLECDEIISSTCIQVKQQCEKVGNLTGENLDKFIQRLCAKLSKIDNNLVEIKSENNLLKSQLTLLQSRITLLENK